MVHAMDFEVRDNAVMLSRRVVGTELRTREKTLSEHPEITTVVLKNSTGEDAKTGYAMSEFIREHKLNTALSALLHLFMLTHISWWCAATIFG